MADQNLRSLPDPRPPGDYHYTRPLLIYALILTLTFLAAQTGKSLVVPVQAQVLHAPVVSPSPSPTVTPTPSTEPTDEPLLAASEDLVEQREAIRQYINVIFGSQGKTAYAISLAEGKARRRYKGEIVYNVNAVRETSAELSVGIFQINLKSKETLVHWARVPGQSEAEKIDWLKNPYNNTLMAYWIYNTSSWSPWSVYENGLYRTFL